MAQALGRCQGIGLGRTELGGWAEEGVTGTGEGLGWENGTGLGRRG